MQCYNPELCLLEDQLTFFAPKITLPVLVNLATSAIPFLGDMIHLYFKKGVQSLSACTPFLGI